MMTTATFTLLTVAFAASVGNAATVIDQPLPFSIYADNKNSVCKGTPLGKGTISSVKAMGDGKFCENTIQKNEIGEERSVYTKVHLNSCEATADMGAVFIDAYVCADSECSLCTDADGIPVSATMMIPAFQPLPAADSCWGIEASTTGVTVLNKFDESVNADFVDEYWQLYLDNSCMKDTVTVTVDGAEVENENETSKTPDSSAPIAAPMALVSSIGLMLVVSLI